MARVGVARLRGTRGYYVDGLTEAKAALAALPDAFRSAAVASIDEGTQVMLDEALRRAPVGYRELPAGHVRLRRSIGRAVREDGLQAAVGSGDFTAKFVEFGTKKMQPQPFLRPAFRKGARLIRKQMKAWAEQAGEQIKFRTKRSKAAIKASKAAKARMAM